MRVLHLFDLFLPNTLNWLNRLLVHTPGTAQWIAAPWILKNEYFCPEFRYFIRPFQTKTGWISSNEWAFSSISSNLIRLERHWPLYRNWLFEQIRNDPPDLLHAHFGPVGCHYLELALALKIPLICSFYGYDFQRLPFQRPVYHERYQKLFEKAVAITTTGTKSPQFLISQSCPPEKIRPVPVSISTREFPFVQRRKQSQQLQLLQVATFTQKKGYMDTLEAFRRALQDCPNAKLTLVGERQDMDLYRNIRAFIHSNDLSESISLMDFIPHQQLPEFLSRFDAFIHPSRTSSTRDTEGAPVTILEAMASGLPVISTWHADIPDQVMHDKTGFLAPEGDPEVLAGFIRRLYLMDQAKYEPFSVAGRAQVLEKFEISQTGKTLSVLYESLMVPM